MLVHLDYRTGESEPALKVFVEISTSVWLVAEGMKTRKMFGDGGGGSWIFALFLITTHTGWYHSQCTLISRLRPTPREYYTAQSRVNIYCMEQQGLLMHLRCCGCTQVEQS